MSGVEFFQTRMGARFYEGTMPKIAEQLERLNDNLERLLAETQKLLPVTVDVPRSEHETR
jgi:hypothetical protein